MSWLHDHQEQLDGYQLYAEIAYRFRPKVLPDDRDDIEVEIVLKLKALPKRMVKTGLKIADGERLNNADKLYLSRKRRNPTENYHHTTEAEAERIRRLYVEEGLSTPKIARITGRGNYTVQRCLKSQGVKLRRRGGKH